MRYLHTMIRVGNLEKSVQFYSDTLGFRELRRTDYPKDKFILVFMQAADDSGDGPMLELTYNYGVESYDLGNGYGHIALQVESMDTVAKKLKQLGTEFAWGPDISPNGKKKMAFIDDPDGYKIELLEFADGESAIGG